MLGLRPPGLEFQILCLEDSVISFISPVIRNMNDHPTCINNNNNVYYLKHTYVCNMYTYYIHNSIWVNIQFKGHLVSFGYSERIYALCGSEFLKYCAMGNTIN